MIAAAWVVGALACYLLTWRLMTMAQYRHCSRRYPRLYSDSCYEYRDAPHGDDIGFSAVLALFFPVTLPALLVMEAVRRFRGDPEQRWLSQRARLAELEREKVAAERERAAIVAELEREYGSGAS